jgi:hypothetical protein
MLFPLTILMAAIAAAAVSAYGADPGWMHYHWGLEFIMLSRRLQWPLLALALAACALTISFVIGGRWRAWWLVGLAPVLALFAHRFVTDPARAWQVDGDAAFVTADQAKYVADSDWVVGLNFDGEDYAYPYNVLFENPVVAQAVPRRRLLLIWSPYANRAVAMETDWALKPRELEIVSMPANAALVYNGRFGQFINGITGLTPDGQRPTGVLARVPTEKMTWGTWRKLHPDTMVLRPPDGWQSGAPAVPLAPRYPIPGSSGGNEIVAFIDGDRPAAISESDVTTAPLNLVANDNPLLVFRGSDNVIRAFARQANGDLTPRFYPVSLPGHSTVAFTEADSKSYWAADGRAIDGLLKGEKLAPFDVDDSVSLDVMRYWYPTLTVIKPQPGDVGVPPSLPRAARHRKLHRMRRPIVVTVSS